MRGSPVGGKSSRRCQRGWLTPSNKFTRKTFQTPKLIHERFLTLDHSCEIFFNTCPTELSQSGKKVQTIYFKSQFSTSKKVRISLEFFFVEEYKSRIAFCKRYFLITFSCVNCAAWKVFLQNLLLPGASNQRFFYNSLICNINFLGCKTWKNRREQTKKNLFMSETFFRRQKLLNAMVIKFGCSWWFFHV